MPAFPGRPIANILSTCCVLLAVVFAESNALAATVKVVGPDELDRFMNNGVSRLFIDGAIEGSTPAQVEKILRSYDGEMDVFINSQGGNLVAGLQTGKVLRKYRATTFVGKYRLTGKVGNSPRVYKIEPGRCESACAYAFLGGHYRLMYSSQSKFGVHRFWSVAGPKVDDLDSGQVMTTAIVNYLTEMQIDPALMSYVVSAGKNEMKYLDGEMMRKLNVINDGRALPQWSLDIGKGGAYLNGQQEIRTGGGRIIVLCDARGTILLTRAQVGSDNAQMIVDEKFIPHFLVQKTGKQAPDSLFEIVPAAFGKDGEYVDVSFIYPYKLGQVLDSLDAFGVGYFVPDQSGRFIGFVLDLGSDENRELIKKFLSNCSESK